MANIIEYRVEITVTNGKYTHVDCDGRMPCILADKIKNVVEEFYKED